MAKQRTRILIGGALLAAVAGALLVYSLVRFPADTTPTGAYMRIAHAVTRGEPSDCFAYLEEEAQHGAITTADYAQRISKRIAETYPEPERSEALARYAGMASSERGAGTWALLAEQRGWIRRLRRDLSGAKSVEIVGERATIVTARGTRYPFRRRSNGIWGLTLFTVELTAESERLARDWAQIQRAAEDYQRAADHAERPCPIGGGKP
jgi:hypothetical protein